VKILLTGNAHLTKGNVFACVLDHEGRRIGGAGLPSTLYSANSNANVMGRLTTEGTLWHRRYFCNESRSVGTLITGLNCSLTDFKQGVVAMRSSDPVFRAVDCASKKLVERSGLRMKMLYLFDKVAGSGRDVLNLSGSSMHSFQYAAKMLLQAIAIDSRDREYAHFSAANLSRNVDDDEYAELLQDHAVAATSEDVLSALHALAHHCGKTVILDEKPATWLFDLLLSELKWNYHRSQQLYVTASMSQHLALADERRRFVRLGSGMESADPDRIQKISSFHKAWNDLLSPLGSMILVKMTDREIGIGMNSRTIPLIRVSAHEQLIINNGLIANAADSAMTMTALINTTTSPWSLTRTIQEIISLPVSKPLLTALEAARGEIAAAMGQLGESAIMAPVLAAPFSSDSELDMIIISQLLIVGRDESVWEEAEAAPKLIAIAFWRIKYLVLISDNAIPPDVALVMKAKLKRKYDNFVKNQADQGRWLWGQGRARETASVLFLNNKCLHPPRNSKAATWTAFSSLILLGRLRSA
jgi:hypothetical protein